MNDSLGSAIRDKSAKVGVVGLGYVGLPLDSRVCRRGVSHAGIRRR